MAERAVGMAKSTLSHQLDGNKSLDFSQVEALFLRVSHILNSRPVGARVLTEDDFHAISPNDLLLGRATRKREDWEAEIPTRAVDPAKTLAAEEELCERWWAEWIRVAFPLLVPRGKWTVQHRNLEVGDIVLLRYEAKFSKDRYRLAKVQRVHPDASGVVRTVTVGMRPRDARDRTLPYRSRPLLEFEVAVQRLVVILPKEEQEVKPAIEPVEESLRSEETVEGDVSVEIRHTEEMKSDRSKNPQRQSRRLKKLDPEVFLTSSAQGMAPRPTPDTGSHIASAMICLARGAPPLKVPTWVLDIFDDDY